MPKNTIPETIQQFWRDSPTEYTLNDIKHLEPFSENAVFLKQLSLLSGETPPIETHDYVTSDGKKYKTSDGYYYSVAF